MGRAILALKRACPTCGGPRKFYTCVGRERGQWICRACSNSTRAARRAAARALRGPLPSRRLPVEERRRRFLARVEQGLEGCWLWTGRLDSEGYTRLSVLVDGKARAALAHRVGYELFVGPIPDGLTLDHLCRVHRCVNPKHLEPVTLVENIRRGNGASARNARKTTCPRGHAYDGTARNRRGWRRYCKRCSRDRQRAAYAVKAGRS